MLSGVRPLTQMESAENRLAHVWIFYLWQRWHCPAVRKQWSCQFMMLSRLVTQLEKWKLTSTSHLLRVKGKTIKHLQYTNKKVLSRPWNRWRFLKQYIQIETIKKTLIKWSTLRSRPSFHQKTPLRE